MIKLNHIHKFFNKGKLNQIHVIDDTSLTFPEKGLVALTGPSGCGKTTLLNVIGGLDKFESGEINFDGQIISRYHPNEWDVLRNHHIGYIFQNYNLITDKTVYENIELSLNMAGLYDKDDIEERINYVLEAVGMYNYRRRNVQALSGGQQQRVAIARAIAKNPKVILADEPTGNLDANNTFEIMSIIKKISQTVLVILVTHEKSMVDFYADTVVEISDGKIVNQYDNSGNRSFEHIDERNIYLKDLNKDDSLADKNIERYFDAEKDEDLGLKIIEIKDSVYIQANSKKKVKYITDDSEIKLIDGHYKAKKTEDAYDYTFDLDKYGKIESQVNKKSFIHFGDTLKAGFKKVTSRRKFIGWLFLIAYFVISALVVYQIATFANLTKLEEKDFLKTSKELVNVNSDEMLTYIDIDRILNNVDNLEWTPYRGVERGNIVINEYYQGFVNRYVSMYPIKLSWADETKKIMGDMPGNTTEIVIDVWVAEAILDLKPVKDIGITTIEELLGQTITTGNYFQLEFEIVGIIDTGSPVVVVDDNAFLSFLQDMYFAPYNAFEERITIIEGREVQSNDEVLLDYHIEDYELGDEYEIEGNAFEIVGFFEYNNEDSYYEYGTVEVIVIDAYVEELAKLNFETIFYWYYGYGDVGSGIYFYSDDMDQAIEDIEAFDAEYSAVNAYESQKVYQQEQLLEKVDARIQSVVTIVIGIIVYIFFMMRSSMLSRIKEIGIYRSIGASKRDIYKIFIGEILAFTTLGSLTGYLAMSYLINRVQNTLGDLISIFYLPLHYFIGGLVFIYLINLIFGMLPIFTLLRKTPSEINVKYDI